MLAYLAACWDEEKRLLARRLHDSLGSSMTALTMHLALLSQHIPPENKAMRDRSAQMKQLLASIIETNRKMQLELWNDKLEFLGLHAALAELVPAFGAEHGLAARTSLPDEDCHYSRTQGVVLLRCAEEGLRNARTHGKASEVEVILDDDGEQVMLTVGRALSASLLRYHTSEQTRTRSAASAAPRAASQSIIRCRRP